MRTRTVCLLVLMAGCTAPNNGFGPGGPDLSVGPAPGDGGGGGRHDGGGGGSPDLSGGGGGGPDLSGGGGGGPDLRTLSCGDIKNLVATLLGNSVACKVDSDCTFAKTACGLEGQCGDVYANTGWDSAEMMQLLMDWKDQMCYPDRCICPAIVLPPPACNMGKCGAKRTGLGVVGAACTADSDCETGQCLTEAQDKNYPGGYCTVKDCNATTNPCPANSACTGSGAGKPICLADCGLVAKCRTSYQCCWGPGPGKGMGWCAPPNSLLCLAR